MELLLGFLAFLFLGIVWFGMQYVPRILARHPKRSTATRTILDKRYVDPVPGDLSGRGTRFQLLLEDEDGRQVWTWCDAETFSAAEPGGTHVPRKTA